MTSDLSFALITDISMLLSGRPPKTRLQVADAIKFSPFYSQHGQFKLKVTSSPLLDHGYWESRIEKDLVGVRGGRRSRPKRTPTARGFGWGLSAEGAVGSAVIVVISPSFGDPPGLS